MTKKRIELLAPAGSPDAYRAAAAAGADAVYLGAKGFNARQQAQNFEERDLEEIMDDARIRGIKMYFVLNTLVSESEIQEAAKLASFVYQLGMDGIIVQDLGLVHVIKEMLPGFPIHASTQMTVHNTDGVKAAQAMGINRIVLARELSLGEIAEIVDNTGAEVEVFAHGALCISRSGQCLLSSFIGGRSGNRGRCAQPCRLPWKIDGYGSPGDYLLSPKDLMTLEILPELIKTGVSALKIEGRMKSPEYVAAVVMVYRKYLDMAMANPERYSVDPADIRMLMQVFNRGGFTAGYLREGNPNEMMSTEHPKNWGVLAGTVLHTEKQSQPRFGGREGDRLISIRLSEQLNMGDGLEIWDSKNRNPDAIISVMMKDGRHVKTAKAGDVLLAGNFKSDAAPGSPVYKTYDKALMESLSGFIQKNAQRVPVIAEFRLYAGRKPELIITDCDGNSVTAVGDNEAQQAREKPTTTERAGEQLKKSGDTPYRFESVRVLTDGNAFIPVSEINTIRRIALERLTEIRRKPKESRLPARQFSSGFSPEYSGRPAKQTAISVFFYSVPGGIDWGDLSISRVYLPVNESGRLEEIKKQGIQGYLWIPPILHDHQAEALIKKITEFSGRADGFLAGNIGMLHRIREEFPDIPAALDFQMNIFNSRAIEAVKKYQPSSVMLSLELNLEAIKLIKSADIALEAYVYGPVPVMTLEYCPGSNRGECTRKCGSCPGSRGFLTDRLGKRFMYKTDPSLKRTTLFNSSLLMLDDIRPLMETGVQILRIGIMDETPEEIQALCRFFQACRTEDNEGCGHADSGALQRITGKSLTRGHYYRGV